MNVRPVLHINGAKETAELAGGVIELPGGIDLPIPTGLTVGALWVNRSRVRVWLSNVHSLLRAHDEPALDCTWSALIYIWAVGSVHRGACVHCSSQIRRLCVIVIKCMFAVALWVEPVNPFLCQGSANLLVS